MLGLADAIHNFKWVKIVQIWQNEVQRFLVVVDSLKAGIYCANK